METLQANFIAGQAKPKLTEENFLTLRSGARALHLDGDGQGISNVFFSVHVKVLLRLQLSSVAS